MNPRLSRSALGVALFCLAAAAQASSHREAPFLTTVPKVDATDFFMFNSYEAGRTGYVTLIANYLPLQDGYGGPNYFSMDPNALYEIHIDNVGDAKEHISFQFRFKNTLSNNGAGTSLNVGGKMVVIPLIQSGAVANVKDANLQLNESYTLTVVRGDRRSGTAQAVTHATSGATSFDKPVDNIGKKKNGHQITPASSFSFWISSATEPTFTPALRPAGSTVFTTERRGETSTP